MRERRAYLEALGLTAWERRDVAADVAEVIEPRHATVVLGPGKGSCLFLCGAGDDSASALASDLARVTPEAPVWAQVQDDEGGQRLEAVIAERLISQLVIFGEAAARLVFGGAPPEHAGPARVTVVDDLARLARDPGARRACWAAFRAAGLPATR